MTWEVEIDSIAGIVHGTATIEPGLNAVQASNWQGKSSFITALKTALGTTAELTEGHAHGGVSVSYPDGQLRVDLARNNGTITTTGSPYLTGEHELACAELFACLDEANPIRRAIRAESSLESVLLRPLDFENIDEQIAELTRERERIETELSQAQGAQRRLDDVASTIERLEREIEQLTSQRDAIDGEPPSTDDTAAGPHEELAQARSKLQSAESRVRRLEGSIERIENRRSDRQEKRASLTVPDRGSVVDDLEAARETLERHKRDTELLQSVYTANERLLHEGRLDVITDVTRALSGDTVECWVCGGEQSTDAFERRLDELAETLSTLRARTDRHREQVDDLEAKREEITQLERHKSDLDEEIDELEARLEDHSQELETATERVKTAQQRVDELTDAIDGALEKRSDIDSEIKYRQAELTETRTELQTLENRAERVELLQNERKSTTAAITQLRERKDTIKRETRAAFDEAIDDLLARFETGFETARLTDSFELVVARDGRRASLSALSEGERELLGFVTALAGRAAFDVAETVPLLLVDGIGGLAADNLRTLVEYLHERTEYLVFTAYPEHTMVAPTVVDPTEWTIANAT